MNLRIMGRVAVIAVVLAVSLATAGRLSAAEGEFRRLAVLFLGDNGHHRPAERAQQALVPLAKRGIDIFYHDSLDVLRPDRLAAYDCLLIYANQEQISPEQEEALLDYVAGGHGLAAIHCASYCFLNSPRYTQLVGARFLRHGGEVFQPRITDHDHPLTRGLEEFQSWDETYVHEMHNVDRLVLMERATGDEREPWTWVRKYDKGRVFYTASGHDERTWSQAGFIELLVRGIRWAADVDPAGEPPQAPFEYVQANAEIPNYVAGAQWGTVGEALGQMQLPLAPAASLARAVTAPELQVELLAAEPDITKPLTMAWDDRGRLWIVESVDYPNDRVAAGAGHDRIKICEDTDHDGKADKFTVFAEGLSIPTSLLPVTGGVIVAQAPDVLLLTDTDGDGKADQRKVLFTGWGTDDTHAGPSQLRLGPDNWAWGTVGYAGFYGVVGGTRHQFRQGLFRFRADGSELEFLGSTSNNMWGLGFSEEGTPYASTANSAHSLMLVVPNRVYESVRGWHAPQVPLIADHKLTHPITDKVRQVDWHGGFTAAAGHALYTARAFPREYWNSMAFVCEPTAHVVHQCRLAPRGAAAVSHDGWNLLATDDEWTSPIAAEVGPDGAVWVIDWYNYIVQHNPTPPGFETGRGNAYVTPLRDKQHGRIWRVVPKSGLAPAAMDLASASPQELIGALSHTNFFWRMRAQRLLVERGNLDVVDELIKLIGSAPTDEIGVCPAAMHTLWTLEGLGAVKDGSPIFEAAVGALKHPTWGVRRAALAVLPRTVAVRDAIVAAGVHADTDPRVQLAALSALAEMPAIDGVAQMALDTLAAPKLDPWLAQAATAAAAANDRAFLSEAAKLKTDQVAQPLTAALRAVGEHFGRQGNSEALPELIARLSDAGRAVIEPVVAGLAAGWNADRPVPADEAMQDQLVALLDRVSTEGQASIAALASRWKLEGKFAEAIGKLRQEVLEAVMDEGRPDGDRLAAARRLVVVGLDDDSAREVTQVVSPRASPELVEGLLAALSASTSEAVAPALLERWNGLSPAGRQSAVAVLLGRPAWTAALVEALASGSIDPAELRGEQIQQLVSHPNRTLAWRAGEILSSQGRLPSADRKEVLERLLPLAEKSGDAAAGKLVFEKNCAKCHRLGDIGQAVGPDLTGIAVRPRREILTEVLDPNRSVEGNYRQYTVVTSEGRVMTGLLKSESRTTIELLDTEAKRHVIVRDEIDEIEASTKSVMPEGFEKLPPEELTALITYLSTPGRFLPLPLAKAATIASNRGMFYSRRADLERLVFPRWGLHTIQNIPFYVLDPGTEAPNNVILLHGPAGEVSRAMPREVRVPCNSPAVAVHLLGGVSGWGHPYGELGSVSLIVRLHYADGSVEDHGLQNGVHLADYIRVVDVPESKLAFELHPQQVRYLAIVPQKSDAIAEIEFVKGDDATAPVIVAVTVERPGTEAEPQGAKLKDDTEH